MKLVPSAVLLLTLAGHALAFQDSAPSETQIRGKVDAVTIYRGQALVTRALDVPANRKREIVITDLPGAIEPASLHAESDGAVKVQSVRYRERPITTDVNEDVRKLDGRIEELANKLAANARHVALLEEQHKYIDSLQGFVAPTASAELRSGVLNADTLQKMTSFILEQRTKLAEQELALAKEKQDLDRDLQQAHREREKITAGSSRTMREAVITLAADSGAGPLRLRYIVDNASWSPSYSVRRDSASKSQVVRLEYYADITQLSGEDWDGAAMTLSTATPSLTSRGPQLLPMTVALAPMAAGGKGGADEVRRLELLNKDYDVAKREIADKQRSLSAAFNSGNIAQQPATQQAEQSNRQYFQTFEDATRDDRKLRKEINDNAADDQLLDLMYSRTVTRGGGEKPGSTRTESLSVSYVIPGASNVPSRADHQLIQIGATPLRCEFAKVAAPALTEYVYDEAAVTNESGMVFLAGPVTAYADGAFVGRGDLPTVSAGESFTVGFGIDSSLRAHRELVERTESTQGGNRVINVTYRLKLENFGKDPAKVRLTDRIPVSSNKDIQITMGQTGAPLSDDADYVKTKGKTGLLRWDVLAPANSGGSSEWALEYSFKIEHDKQMFLSGMVK